MRHLAGKVIQYFSRIKVVHHLPGRLRLHIPFLEKLSPEWRQCEAELAAFIKLGEGLVDVKLSAASGQALILYDHHRTDKDKILRWFRQLAILLSRDFLETPSESRQHIALFLKKRHARYRRLLQRDRNAQEVR